MVATEKPTIDEGIVAVTEQVSTAGAVTFWNLSGQIRDVALRRAWEQQGLDPGMLPSLPSPRVALTRALAEVRARRVLVRPFEGGWAVVREHEDVGTLDYRVAAAVKIDPVGQLEWSRDPTNEIKEIVQSEYERCLFQLDTPDVSAWLISLAETLHGVALRETGGVYYLPPSAVETWRRIVVALREAGSGCAVHEIPAMRSEEAVAAILAAVEREADSAVAQVESDLSEGGLGARAVRTREAKMLALEQKLAEYEEQLGRALPELSRRLESLRGNLAAALLAAEAEQERG